MIHEHAVMIRYERYYQHVRIQINQFNKQKYTYLLRPCFIVLANKFTGKIASGYAVAQWLRECAKTSKVTGAIPDDIIGIFIDIILPTAL
jgi:hypothetical protein